MGKKLNFAVIGCGALARQQHIPNIAKSEKANLYACCDLSDAALAECKEKYNVPVISKDWKSVILDPNVDAICLATTEKLRKPVIEFAAVNGKPVYVEKPLATNLPEMYEIQEIVHLPILSFYWQSIKYQRIFLKILREKHFQNYSRNYRCLYFSQQQLVFLEKHRN